MEEDAIKFQKAQEDVLKNLAVLLFNLNICTDAGMLDKDETMYNRIQDIIDEVNTIDSMEELEEFVAQAKTIESQIDLWLVSQGEVTISLDWPSF